MSQALVENGLGQRYLEPMVNLAPGDLQELMHNGGEESSELTYGLTITEDTGLVEATGGHARRTMLASDWLGAVPSLSHGPLFRRRSLWTHVLTAETPPCEHGFVL